MALILEVISYKGRPLDDALTARFDESGGSIGRIAGNLLVLPDPDKQISRHHGDIRCENGTYVYADVSTGGTWISSLDGNLSHDAAPLSDGDHLKIGEYELKVSIEAGTSEFPDLFSTPQVTRASYQQVEPEPLAFDTPFEIEEGIHGARLDIEDFSRFSPADKSPPDLAQHAAPFQENYIPPDVQREAIPAIPEDFSFDDFLKSDGNVAKVEPAHHDIFQVPATEKDEFEFPDDLLREFALPDSPAGTSEILREEPAPIAEPPQSEPSPFELPRPGRPQPPPAAEDRVTHVPPAHEAKGDAPRKADLFRCFLEGAGIEDFPAMSEDEQVKAMTVLGAVYRDLIDGMMRVLRGRAEERREIQTDVTIIRSDKNNPLKFIPRTEDAMKLMISGKQAGYIDFNSAVREGFSDIMKHQMAMRAGMQAAVTGILKRFEPNAFERPFEQGIVFQKKAKCWDAYSRAYPNLVREAMDDLFGPEFTEAYEIQLRKLRDSASES